MMKPQALSLLSLFALLCMSKHAHADYFSRFLKFGEADLSRILPFIGRGGTDPNQAAAARAAGKHGRKDAAFEEATLANGHHIPLVGLGVGNSPYQHVSALVSEAIQNDKRTRLIDTSHASGNEDLVAEGIVDGAERLGQDEKVEVHVVTKVWYTHLGYERTKLSVQDSLKALSPALKNNKVDLKIHLMLHWPRCYDSIEWMNCAEEEADLEDRVKNAGPNPARDPDSWKESWKFFEDIYLSHEYPIESIGASNFHLHDLEHLNAFAKVQPHVLQVDLWSILYDSMLVEYCHKHDIHMQAFNIMHNTLTQPGTAPRAYNYIQKIANDLASEVELPVTPAQAVLAWLIQHGISVVPRTSKLSRVEENSAVSVSTIPPFTEEQVEIMAQAVECYLTGDDMEKDIHAHVTFYAVDQDLMLYWMGEEGSEEDEVRVAVIRKGNSFNETTFPGHVFRTYNAYDKDEYLEHQVAVNYGEHQDIRVSLS